MTCHGYCRNTALLPTTLTPADEDAAVVVERIGQPVVGQRGVDGAFGIGREDGVEVVGRRDARRSVEPGELCGVLARLGLRGDPDAGQLEPRSR